MTTPLHIAHLTSVHPREDVRIFRKQCQTLAQAGYRVTLIVADDKGDDVVEGVSIRDVGKSRSRLRRILSVTRRIYQAARKLDAKVFHFHDPELLPVGLLLKRQGRSAVFDAHEDVSKQIMEKHYIPGYARTVTSALYRAFEGRVSWRLDAVVCATPSIAKTFADYGVDSTVVSNFPILDELVISHLDFRQKKNTVCYVGGLAEVRGIREIVTAAYLSHTGVQLKLGGPFESSSFEREFRELIEAKKAVYLGWLGRGGVAQLFSESIAGLVTFHATPNHVESLPTKMFEYMSAGLPVIASDFPLWRNIIREADCGICVDPTDIQAIADAMDALASKRERAEEMGRNGRFAVRRKYNWNNEANKLLALYERLVGPPSA